MDTDESNDQVRVVMFDGPEEIHEDCDEFETDGHNNLVVRDYEGQQRAIHTVGVWKSGIIEDKPSDPQ